MAVSAAGITSNSNTPSSTPTTTLPSFVMESFSATPQFSFTVALSLLSTPSSISSSAPAQTFTVQVGNGDHKFKPDVIQAEVGDIVEFDFYPVNHSVIRAEYEHPCIPYEMTGRGKTGFWSGFHATDVVLDDPPKYTVRVNDTNPVFFYCSAPDSCTNQGMVGVINPNASTSLAHQRDLALQASYQLSPGEPFPFEAETPSSSTLPNGTALQTLDPAHAGAKLGAGAIAGISIAAVGVVVLGVLLAFFWGRLKSLKDEVNRKDSTVVRSTEPRNTWFLAGSPSTHTWPSPGAQTLTQNQPSPPYSATVQDRDMSMGIMGDVEAGSPMTSHAVPPAYYESPAQWSRNGAVGLGISGDTAAQTHMSRAASRRSVGGTFEQSPVTGAYTRTHEGSDAEGDAYKFAPPTMTSDMTSPVDPGLVGPSELQRANRTPEVREGYVDEKGRWVGRHVNREDPAEMADTSVAGGRL
ncbi:hypothetical protein P171DRAFT_173807 [Karstenula rhodostoma CBS 690.94]|uniref:Cupredoxin n=1 Tax=Karstenula rhodostoma CBS 690.94 TaxID=1392251 RepID=A0A9P4U6B3_9PLEO|nr:hypothetical protein P171DRAFT_173807 [Karstenula rhodostoma CBS 690.94]